MCRSAIPQKIKLNVTVSLRQAINRIFADDPEFQCRRAAAESAESARHSVVTTPIGAAVPIMAQAGLNAVETNVTSLMSRIVAVGAAQLEKRSLFLALELEPWKCYRHQLVSPAARTLYEDFLDQLLDDAGAAARINAEEIATLVESASSIPTAPRPPSSCITDDMISAILFKAIVLKYEPEVIVLLQEVLTEFIGRSLQAVASVALGSCGVADGRLVITSDEMIQALTVHGHSVYGYGGPCGVRYLFGRVVSKVLSQIHPSVTLDAIAMSVIHDMTCGLLYRIVHRAMQSAGSMQRGPFDYDDGTHICMYTRVPAGATRQDTDFELDNNDMHDTYVKIAIKEDEARNNDSGNIIPNGVTVVQARDIQNAVILIFRGELAKHAVSEGTKAVLKWEGAGCSLDDAAFSRSAGLQFLPQDVALLVEQLFPSCMLTAVAAVCLAAVLEYMVAEISELSGNAASESGEPRCIFPHHVLVCVRSDEELNNLFQGSFRDGGMVVDCPELHEAPGAVPVSSAISAYGELMEALGVASPRGIVVDPISGAHTHVATGAGTHLPVLDAASGMAAADRAHLAYGLLSEEQKAIVDAARLDPLAITPSKENTIQMRRNLAPSIDCSCFARRVYHDVSAIANTGHWDEFLLTAEAMGALQTATEAHLLNLATAARGLSLSAHQDQPLDDPISKKQMKFVIYMSEKFSTWGTEGAL